jgi:hypothetical protein
MRASCRAGRRIGGTPRGRPWSYPGQHADVPVRGSGRGSGLGRVACRVAQDHRSPIGGGAAACGRRVSYDVPRKSATGSPRAFVTVTR